MSNLIQLLQRMRKPRTIEQALKQVCSPKVISRLTQLTPAGRLVEAAAKAMRVPPLDLLSQAACRLGLEHASPVHVPTQETVKATGYSAELLRSLGVAPQESLSSPHGYSLVVAAPEKIATEDFFNQGISVFLGLGSEIDGVWDVFFSRLAQDLSRNKPLALKEMPGERLFGILASLIEQASALGTSELFIGHPDDKHYEFLAGDRRYSGRIHPDIYRDLLGHFSAVKRRLNIPTASKNIAHVYASLTRDGNRPVFFFTWERVEDNRVVPINSAPETNPPFLAPFSTNDDQTPAVTQEITTNTPEQHLSEATGCDSSNDTSAAPKAVPIYEAAAVNDHRVVIQKDVLLVDDDDRFRLILKRILESKGWKVTESPAAKDSLSLISGGTVSPSLIICDVHMPNMDGAEFLRRLRSGSFFIPVLMLTSDENSLLEAELAMLGADAFVRKQEDPRVLLAWCNNLASRNRGHLPPL